MANFNDMIDALKATEILAKAFDAPPFEIYILGGAGCVLAGYLDRATRDFDIIDLDYSASLGLVMKPLEPFDMIDLNLATIPADYKNRATRLIQFEFLQVYVLSRVDIIISKISRLNERDMNDIRELMPHTNTALLFDLIYQLPNINEGYLQNFQKLLEALNVQNHVQQLEKLRQRLQQ